ncbi:MAG: YncE family protein [Gemmatimonadota bacterium]
MHKTLLAVVVLSGASTPTRLAAQFQTLETRNLRLIYTSPLQSYLVPQVSRSFQNSLQFYRRLYDYTPQGKITVLLHDLWHYGNAGARPLPENHITVGIEPYSHEYESAPAPERMTSSLNHEMAHIVTVDKATGSDRFFRSIFFGKVTPDAAAPPSMLYGYLTTPRWYSPRWYLEGIATYYETWMNGGLGRAIGPYDEMVFRTLVRDSARIYDVVGLESEGTTIDFQVGVNSYLYGTRFVSYLALRYGNDSLLAWYNRSAGSRRWFASQFGHVYGRSLEDEWGRWIAWERDWQHANLAAIRMHPTTVARPITAQRRAGALGSVSRAFYDSAGHRILVAIRYPGQEAAIAAIDVATGRIRRLHDVQGAAGFSVTSLAYDRASGTLFYTTNNADWRHLVSLDSKTGRTTVLQHDARIGDLVFNPADRSLWGVRHDDGYSTLVRVPAPWREWKQVWTLPYGEDLFDLDIAPDGSTLIGSMSEVDGSQRLVRMEVAALLRGDTTHTVLYEFGDWSPSNFVYSPDGRFLFGSSYYSGVSNIYRYDLEARVMRPLSNAETGFFKPVPLTGETGDSVLVFAYSGRGFVPALIPNQVTDSVSAIRFLGNAIAEQRPEVQTWMPPPVSSLQADSVTTPARPYRSLRNFRLDSAYPVAEGYEDAAGHAAAAVGVRLNFSDRIGATALDVTASASPDRRLSPDERYHLAAVFHHWGWTASATWNRADFYDFFGPTKLSRRGWSVGLAHQGNLIFDTPRSLTYTLEAQAYGDLATLPEYQGVRASFDKLQSFSGSLAYASLRRSLGAVEDELGTTWDLQLRGNEVNGTLFPRWNLDASKGVLLPLDHSSLWLRGSAGSALGGNRSDPFANFFFGGFANNWVDHRAIKQFRETESFPGVDINAVGGSNYAKVQAEWTTPPLRFRRAGSPGFYFRWVDLSLYTTGLVTNVDHRALRRKLASVGAQLDVRSITLSHLESTFSVGYAAAVERGRPFHSAWMFSFKIM